MSSNWASGLDMLAQNGVLDFDAPAFIMDQAPRYIGSPSGPVSPYIGGPLPNAPALTQPKVDEFKQEKTKLPPSNNNKDTNFVKNPSWKKILFGALALTAAGFGIYKFKSVKNYFKTGFNNLTNKFSFKSIKTFVSNKAKAVGKFFKNCWTKIKNVFKKP